MRRLLFIITAATLVVAALVVARRLSSDIQAAEHCVVQVLGQADSGELVTTEPVCVTGDDLARADLYSASGIAGQSINVTLANAGSDARVTELAAAGASILGVHYDGANFSGSSFAVFGSNCAGGYINLSSSWVNRVSSTDNVLCSRIKHHDYYNTGGSYQSTWGSGGNLSYMANRANSISYTTS